MGKSVGFLGPVSGRVGNTVGYVLKDAGKQTQGWRVYQPNVGNPQTDAQMQQRIRLTAINNQYRALREIITRGFEGLDYGNVSRRKYLSMAMGQRFEGPWLVKDDKRPVPVLNIPITIGSLPQITAVYFDDGDAFITSLASTLVAPYDMGNVSEIFVENGYQNGDQVTFIMAKSEGAAVLMRWYSFYVDTGSTEELPEWLSEFFNVNAGFVEISTIDGFAPDALAIAVSRDGDGSHLRSTSYWAINEEMEALFYDPSGYRQNSPSYIRHRSASTNWELDAETEDAGGGGGGGSVQLAYTISGLEIEPQGLTVYSVNNPIQIIGANGNQFYIRTKSGNDLAYVNAAGSVISEIDGATNANTVDVYLERNKAQNLRKWLIDHGIQATILPAYT